MKIQRTKRFSTFLGLALEDLARCHVDSRYEVRMSSWHEPFPSPRGWVCRVCLAGAVMAQSFKLDRSVRASAICEGKFSDRDRARFRALDFFRASCAVSRGEWKLAGFTSSRWALRLILRHFLPSFVEWDASPERFVGWAQLVGEELAREELRVQRRLRRLRRVAADRALREACAEIELKAKVSP